MRWAELSCLYASKLGGFVLRRVRYVRVLHGVYIIFYVLGQWYYLMRDGSWCTGVYL